jgi:hypothetical protein
VILARAIARQGKEQGMDPHHFDASDYTPADISPIPPATRESWFQRLGMRWKGAKEAHWWSPADNACGHAHRSGLRFDLDLGLEERRRRVFPGEDSGCKCYSIPIYTEHGRPVGKDRFERNIRIMILATGAIFVSVVLLVNKYGG